MNSIAVTAGGEGTLPLATPARLWSGLLVALGAAGLVGLFVLAATTRPAGLRRGTLPQTGRPAEPVRAVSPVPPRLPRARRATAQRPALGAPTLDRAKSPLGPPGQPRAARVDDPGHRPHPAPVRLGAAAGVEPGHARHPVHLGPGGDGPHGDALGLALLAERLPAVTRAAAPIRAAGGLSRDRLRGGGDARPGVPEPRHGPRGPRGPALPAPLRRKAFGADRGGLRGRGPGLGRADPGVLGRAGASAFRGPGRDRELFRPQPGPLVLVRGHGHVDPGATLVRPPSRVGAGDHRRHPRAERHFRCPGDSRHALGRPRLPAAFGAVVPRLAGSAMLGSRRCSSSARSRTSTPAVRTRSGCSPASRCSSCWPRRARSSTSIRAATPAWRAA